MLAYSNYKSDGRVVRYAQTLARRGNQVSAVVFGDGTEPLGEEDFDGVKVYKIQRRHEESKKGPLSHLLPLLAFFVRSSVFLARMHFRHPYDLIHVHNIPEWLVFAALLPKIFGARVILDIHDLVPELYSAKFKKGNVSFLEPALKIVERLCCKFADHVIISNHLWRRRVIERSVQASRCSAFCNNIDPTHFYPRPRTRLDDRKIVIFPGTLQRHQGVDIAIRAFPTVSQFVPTAEFHIYGGGDTLEELKLLARELGLVDKVRFFPGVPLKEMPQLIANADLGIVPKRADSFGNEAYSTKIMEFMSQGIPVVLSKTAIDTYYFDDTQVRFCESGNVGSFAAGIIEVLTDENLRERLVQNAFAYVARNHWESRKQEYLDLVDGLISGVDACLPPALPVSEEGTAVARAPHQADKPKISADLQPVAPGYPAQWATQTA